MIVEYTKDYFNEAVEFTLYLNKGVDAFRYYPSDKQKIEEHRIKKDQIERVKTLLFIENNTICGLIDYNEIKSERYIQITAMFIEGNFDRISQVFFTYLFTWGQI